MVTVRLKEGREKSALHHHPWVFSGAVDRVEGEPAPGAVVRVATHDGRFVARGHWSPASQIRVRLLSWDESEAINREWWRRRISEALARREGIPDGGRSDCLRLVHAEADLLPGLVVDRYGDFLVAQFLAAGTDALREVLADLLMELASPRGVYERSDAEVRRLEGLEPVRGILRGEMPPADLVVEEDGARFAADLAGGQKTGLYLDQRRNRGVVAAWAAGREVLDCFCYAGGFSVRAALAGAASLTLVDSSGPALAAAGENLRRNGVDGLLREAVEGDVFEVLRRFRDAARSFDLVVLDPPRLAPTRAHAAKASRAYKDANLLGMKLLRPGGLLATFSCSGGVDKVLFQEIVSWAGHDAGREVQILDHLGQGPDHPVRLSFPESEYLKGLLCRVL